MVALLIACVLQQTADDRDAETRKKLETVKIDVSLSDSSVEDAIDFIRELTGLPFHFDPVGAPSPKEQTFSIDAKDALLGSALRDSLRVCDLDYVVLDGLIFVTSIKGREAIEAGPKSDDFKKDKELWRQLSARTTLAGGTTIAEAAKKLAAESGLKFKTESLTQEELGEKIQGDLPELTTISSLRMIAWMRGLTFEVKDGTVTLTKAKK